ncbi:hypothetical protein [Litorimonas sp. WD9-15]|uniref:hypothetical protein n=1 Tax=Litorimonas sp. WD9-15 TaxID=3418716 RepID=UPI003D03D863
MKTSDWTEDMIAVIVREHEAATRRDQMPSIILAETGVPVTEAQIGHWISANREVRGLSRHVAKKRNSQFDAWPEAEAALVVALWRQGIRVSQIAVQLQETFGGQRTPSHVSGWVARNREKFNLARRKGRDAVRSVTLPQINCSSSPRRQVSFTRAPVTAPPRTCQWIVSSGAGDTEFCGGDIARGSYCKTHAAKVYVARPKRPTQPAPLPRRHLLR